MLMGIATVTIIMVTAVLHAHSRRFTDGLLLDPDRGEPFGLAAVLFYASERMEINRYGHCISVKLLSRIIWS